MSVSPGASLVFYLIKRSQLCAEDNESARPLFHF